MSVLKDFALPDLGEGLTESEIVSWHVDVGDTVTLNQIIADVETAKALVELPSPFAGVVNRLYAEPGTTVQVGTPIVTFEIDDADAPRSDAPEPDAPEPDAPEPDATGTDATASGAAAGRQSVLVGYGPKIETGERPKRRQRSAAAASGTQPQSIQPAVGTAVGTAERPRSTPPVRTLARDLGIDLASVRGTGQRGLITREDVQAVADPDEHAVGSAPAESSADRRIPVAGVRKATAAAMVSSAFTAPHVTEFLTVDVTETMDLLESLKLRHEFRQSRLNILTIVAKALCVAVRRTPEVNAHWEDGEDGSAQIIEHAAVNLGIAAATPRGLLVPNIAGADRLGLAELADALGELVATARAGRTSPVQLTGGTITITNVGVFGIDAGTPIINPGEAAILAMGAVRKQPWEHRGEIALRQVMTLSLSFDHRMVDGEQGSRFLADVGAILAEPGVVLAMV